MNSTKEINTSPKTVAAHLNYHFLKELPNGGKETIHLGAASTKFNKVKPHTTLITDVKSCDEDFTLDKNGFQYLMEPTSLKPEEASNRDFVKDNYYPEVVDTIKRITGASSVSCESHLVRSSTCEEALEEAKRVRELEGEHAMTQLMSPARIAHVSPSIQENL